MVFVGIWAMHHDKSEYAKPDEFNPDRYINHPKLANEYAVSPNFSNRDEFFYLPLSPLLYNSQANMSILHHYGYGAGRRMCPGLHLAERNMWRILAKLLWAFDISEPTNPVTEQPVHLDENAYTSAILMCPLPFTVNIVPRSAEHVACIQRELSSAMDFMSQYN